SSTSSEVVCCPEAMDSCGDYPCWSTESTEVTYTGIGLRVSVSDAVEAEISEVVRTEMRLSWMNDIGEVEKTEWAAQRQLALEFSHVMSEYCATLEIRSLLTGEVRSLRPVCVPHGDHPDVGDMTVYPSAVTPEALSWCPVPVEGFLEEWCEGASTVCKEEGYDLACIRVAQHCPKQSDGDPPVEEDSDANSPVDEGSG